MESGETIANLIKEWGIPQSALSMMKKNIEKTWKLFEEDKLWSKHIRAREHPDIEKAPLTWFKHEWSHTITNSGPTQAQA